MFKSTVSLLSTVHPPYLPTQHPLESGLRAKQLQIALVSATFPDHVRLYAAKIAPSANKIELQKEQLSVDDIRLFCMNCCDKENK